MARHVNRVELNPRLIPEVKVSEFAGVGAVKGDMSQMRKGHGPLCYAPRGTVLTLWVNYRICASWVYQIDHPPSMRISWPVIQPPASVASRATAPLTSSERPVR